MDPGGRGDDAGAGAAGRLVRRGAGRASSPSGTLRVSRRGPPRRPGRAQDAGGGSRAAPGVTPACSTPPGQYVVIRSRHRTLRPRALAHLVVRAVTPIDLPAVHLG